MWRPAFVTLKATFLRTLAEVSTGRHWILLHNSGSAYCDAPEQRGVPRRCYVISSKALKDGLSRIAMHQY